jgi:hypothetical protein
MQCAVSGIWRIPLKEDEGVFTVSIVCGATSLDRVYSLETRTALDRLAVASELQEDSLRIPSRTVDRVSGNSSISLLQYSGEDPICAQLQVEGDSIRRPKFK